MTHHIPLGTSTCLLQLGHVAFVTPPEKYTALPQCGQAIPVAVVSASTATLTAGFFFLSTLMLTSNLPTYAAPRTDARLPPGARSKHS